MSDVLRDEPACIVQGQRHLGADAIPLDRAVEAFDLPVGLWIVRRGFNVSHAADADEFFEVLSDELGAVIGNDAWTDAWKSFAGFLNDGFHVAFLHMFADFPVDEETAIAVENAA